MIQRSAKRVAWLLVLLAVLAGAVYGVKDGRLLARLPDWVPWAGKKAKQEPRTDKASRGDIELRFKEVGALAPKVEIEVRPPVDGQVKRVFVAEGESVVRGQKLALIQPGKTEAEQKLYVPTEVRAAIDGVVLYVLVNEGDSVQAGGDKFMRVADLKRMTVRLEIGEAEILKLKTGMEAAVTVDPLPGEKFRGRVAFISPAVVQEDDRGWRRRSGSSFLVKADVEGSDERFKPGMTARIDILLEKKAGVVKAPLGGVFEEMGEAVAFVKTASGHEERTLKLGLRNENEVEVVEGLKAGETLLLEKPEDAGKGAGRKTRKVGKS